MTTKYARTPFVRLLESLGDAEAERRIKPLAGRRAIKSWRLCDRRPRPDLARDIAARLSVSLDDIYRHDEAA
jgi:hypothetical protein